MCKYTDTGRGHDDLVEVDFEHQTIKILMHLIHIFAHGVPDSMYVWSQPVVTGQ